MDLTIRGDFPEARLDRRNTILQLEQTMLGSENQIGLPVVHHYANKVYGREMFIPAGVTVVGKIHRYSCVNVLAQGKIRVATEYGVDEYTAPDVFVSIPGLKRCIYAEKDSTFITFHPAEDNNLEEIEQNIIAPSYENLLEVK